MSASLPPSWPVASDDEVLPEVYLSIASSAWPPATDTAPAGVAELSTWQVTRELVGNALPGNLRGTSGLSIGDAQVTAKQSDGKPMAPWGRGDRRVAGGVPCSLYATHTGPTGTDRLNLGAWVTDPMSGSLASPDLGIELLEKSYTGRVPNALPNTYVPQGATVEAAWIVDTLARQGGFYSTPAPVASCRLSLPLQGSPAPERGVMASLTSWPASWSRSTGPMGPDVLSAYYYGQPTAGNSSNGSATLAANITGTVRFNFTATAHAERPQVEVRPGGVLAVRNHPGASFVTGTYAAGLSPEHPLRVEVQVERTGSYDVSWTQFRARARSGPDAAWGSWVTSGATVAGSGQYLWGEGLGVEVSTGSSVSGVQLCDVSEAGVWNKPTANVDPLLGQMFVAWLPAPTDAWAGIQEVCSSFLGAAFVSADGVFTCRNRDYLAGVGQVAETVVVEDKLEDLAWNTDPADTADRLVVTYNPVDRQGLNLTTSTYPIAWEAPDPIEVKGGQTIQVIADVQGWTSGLLDWVQGQDPLPNMGSTWLAYTNREGTGSPVAATALSITTAWRSAGRFIITIKNNTGGTLYTVDGNGKACLILRGVDVARQDNQATTTRGADENVALNPVTVDLGKHVQRPEDATAIADYIWGRVSVSRWSASQISIRRDLTRDIGDLIWLTDIYSDLSTKALITGIDLSGSDGEIAQKISVAILPPTWFDFDAAWATSTWSTGFDPLWASSNWATFDTDPAKAA